MAFDLVSASRRDPVLQTFKVVRQTVPRARQGAYKARLQKLERAPLGFRATFHVSGPAAFARYEAHRATVDAAIRSIVQARCRRAFSIEIEAVRERSIEYVLLFTIADPVSATEILRDSLQLAKLCLDVLNGLATLIDRAGDGGAAGGTSAPGLAGFLKTIAAWIGVVLALVLGL